MSNEKILKQIAKYNPVAKVATLNGAISQKLIKQVRLLVELKELEGDIDGLRYEIVHSGGKVEIEET